MENLSRENQIRNMRTSAIGILFISFVMISCNFFETIDSNVQTTNVNFVNTSLSNFSPSTITGYNETPLWNSNNPVEAIIHIDIPAAHDGSVITTGHQINTNGMGAFSNGHWIFTTIQTPWYDVIDGADGPHPVSGHRKFGLKKNAGGSYTLYTRGVDRFQGELGFVILDDALAEEFAFPGADDLWQSFQQGLKNYIQSNSYGNTVTVNTPVKWRPDWAEVKDVLINNKPLNTLGCP